MSTLRFQRQGNPLRKLFDPICYAQTKKDTRKGCLFPFGGGGGNLSRSRTSVCFATYRRPVGNPRHAISKSRTKPQTRKGRLVATLTGLVEAAGIAHRTLSGFIVSTLRFQRQGNPLRGLFDSIANDKKRKSHREGGCFVSGGGGGNRTRVRKHSAIRFYMHSLSTI